LEKVSFELDDEALNSSFERFKILADKKKNIYDDDLRAIVTNEMTKSTQVYEPYILYSLMKPCYVGKVFGRSFQPNNPNTRKEWEKRRIYRMPKYPGRGVYCRCYIQDCG